MDEQFLRNLVEATGLGLAYELFPEDVRAAVAQVEKQRLALRDAAPPTDEPWPPMRVPEP